MTRVVSASSPGVTPRRLPTWERADEDHRGSDLAGLALSFVSLRHVDLSGADLTAAMYVSPLQYLRDRMGPATRQLRLFVAGNRF